MKDETFADKVKKSFGYLEAEYKFKLIVANNSDIRPRTDGIVKYASNTTLILIDSETGQVAVRFVRIQDDERYYLDPVSIHEYLNTSEKEKQILLSRDAKDKDAANTIFNKSFLLLSPEWKSNRENLYLALENQLENYAHWLKENADLCLVGNFSRWPELYEYKINRLMADELRRGGKETVMSVVRDENGTLKTIKRPIFQRERDHLERLKKEIEGK
jgi:hypothetical protein